MGGEVCLGEGVEGRGVMGGVGERNWDGKGGVEVWVGVDVTRHKNAGHEEVGRGRLTVLDMGDRRVHGKGADVKGTSCLFSEMGVAETKVRSDDRCVSRAVGGV